MTVQITMRTATFITLGAAACSSRPAPVVPSPPPTPLPPVVARPAPLPERSRPVRVSPGRVASPTYDARREVEAPGKLFGARAETGPEPEPEAASLPDAETAPEPLPEPPRDREAEREAFATGLDQQMMEDGRGADHVSRRGDVLVWRSLTVRRDECYGIGAIASAAGFRGIVCGHEAAWKGWWAFDLSGPKPRAVEVPR
ncbi:MAG: hypothetical protein AAF715_28730 [Myxococcota bacterium]